MDLRWDNIVSVAHHVKSRNLVLIAGSTETKEESEEKQTK